MPFDEAKAVRAVKFIENLKHWQGEWAGDDFKLMPWQKQIVRDIFGTVNKDSTRRYRTILVIVPRKNGKTELAAAISLYLLFADKEPGVEVYTAASDRDQAREVWDCAKEMYLMCPELQERGELKDYKHKLLNKQLSGKFEPLSKDVLKQHGRNIHGLVFDELHTQKSDDMWSTLNTAQGARRQPLTVGITTAGSDRESLLRDLHEYTQKVNNGVIDDKTHYGVIFSADPDEQSFPPHWYEDEEDHPALMDDWVGAQRWDLSDKDEIEWLDEEFWYAANPSLEREDGTGFRKIDEFRARAKKAKAQEGFRNKFKRLYLNIWTESSSQAIDADDWKDCTVDYNEPSEELASSYGEKTINEMLPTLKAYGGLDLASKHDIAAFVLSFYHNNQYYFKGWYFVPEAEVTRRTQNGRVPYRQWVDQGHLIETPGEVIDFSYIYDIIKDIVKDYQIEEIAFDRWGATQITQQLQDLGLEVVEFGQGYKSMSPPTKELLKIVKSGQLVADTDPVMRWSISNVILQEDPQENLKPHKRKSDDKIDPVVAFVMSLDRTIRHHHGELNKTSKYEEEGLLTL
jgi:phage terminase large subunit-like protein